MRQLPSLWPMSGTMISGSTLIPPAPATSQAASKMARVCIAVDFGINVTANRQPR